MGPHTHGNEHERAQGKVTGYAHYFPRNSTYSRRHLEKAWFDHYLKDQMTAVSETPPVWIYVPGFDQWIGASNFPIPGTQFTRYYLHSDGNANVRNTAYPGRLTRRMPDNEPPNFYQYDPRDPVPSVGGYNTHSDGGVADRAKVYGNRDDILLYQTDILAEDVAIVGPITVTLYASTSAVDTDFIVHLTDVEPRARAGALWVAEGARRGRIGSVEADPRNMETYSEVKRLEPGTIYEWKIAVWPTARVFKKGHRIRIEISSSNFPRYSRNLNTGEGLDGRDMVRAVQAVYHDATHPSNIELPIVPMETLRSLKTAPPPQEPQK